MELPYAKTIASSALSALQKLATKSELTAACDTVQRLVADGLFAYVRRGKAEMRAPVDEVHLYLLKSIPTIGLCLWHWHTLTCAPTRAVGALRHPRAQEEARRGCVCSHRVVGEQQRVGASHRTHNHQGLVLLRICVAVRLEHVPHARCSSAYAVPSAPGRPCQLPTTTQGTRRSHFSHTSPWVCPPLDAATRRLHQGSQDL